MQGVPPPIVPYGCRWTDWWPRAARRPVCSTGSSKASVAGLDCTVFIAASSQEGALTSRPIELTPRTPNGSMTAFNRRSSTMNLGIRGRKAIVCASSQGLGKGCARALAEEGVSLVINGRNRELLDATAAEIREACGVEVTPVVADLGTPAGVAALLKACPEPDILVNNNGGPPFRDFRELDRSAMLTGITMNMLTPIELIQKTIDGMAARGFGRIVNITSSSVKMPLAGLDLSSGARAGLTAFVAGIARSVADKNVTINNLLPGSFDTARLRGGLSRHAKRSGESVEALAASAAAAIPAKRFGTATEFGQVCAFLCSVPAAYMTGQNILLDGGDFPGAF